MKQPLAVFICLVLLLAGGAFSAAKPGSEVLVYPAKQVSGTGPLPYNYRVIDGHIHVGGHPLNPATGFGNRDQQAVNILSYLKSVGVKTIIDLENTYRIQARYQRLLDQEGIVRIHIPLSVIRLPNKKEWQTIKKTMSGPVYIHCKWGADRSGAVIGRYLVEEKGYAPDEAYKAVISGGSHAGALGGLKQGLFYMDLKRFIARGPY